MASADDSVDSPAAEASATAVLQQSNAVPPLSPEERAAWPTSAETSRVAIQTGYSGDEDDEWDDDHEDDDHDDDDDDDDDDEDEYDDD
jgi:hypothetical protein